MSRYSYWGWGKDYDYNDSHKSNSIDSEGNFTPFGISNLGNTCFMNSALQCLLSLSLFTKELDNLIETANNDDLLRAFKELIRTSKSHQVKQIVARKNQIFYGYGQQDSFEFTISFLETLFDENPRGANELFLGKSQSIVRCKKCNQDMSIPQTFSSIILSLNAARRVTYVPFSMEKSVVRMFNKPRVSESVSGSYRSRSRSIKDYILMTKDSNKYIAIDQICPQYPEIYAFELPSEKVKKGHCFTVVQLKTAEKMPVTYPFICEVPLGEIEEGQLRSIIYERLSEVIPTRKSRTHDFIVQIKKPQPLIFTQYNDQISSQKVPLSNEYVTVTMNTRGIDFRDRREVNQRGDIDLTQLFDGHVKQTQLDPPSTWGCDMCNRRSRAFQRVKFTSLPKVLLFQIKRSSDDDYSPDSSGVSFPQTISVDIQGEYGKMTPNPAANTPGVKYELRSISHHGGSFCGGHYWAYGKRGNKWYDFNDSSCHSIGAPSGSSSSSHMAFYQMVQDAKAERLVEEKDDSDFDVSDDEKEVREEDKRGGGSSRTSGFGSHSTNSHAFSSNSNGTPGFGSQMDEASAPCHHSPVSTQLEGEFSYRPSLSGSKPSSTKAAPPLLHDDGVRAAPVDEERECGFDYANGADQSDRSHAGHHSPPPKSDSNVARMGSNDEAAAGYDHDECERGCHDGDGDDDDDW